jgi:hypothetical protein
MNGTTAIPEGALVALYLNAQGKVLLIEDLKNVQRDVQGMVRGCTDARPSIFEGPVVSFRRAEGLRCCYVRGKCYPCTLLEFIVLTILQFIVALVKGLFKRA